MGPERQEGPEVLSARVGGPVAGVGLRRAGGGRGAGCVWGVHKANSTSGWSC